MGIRTRLDEQAAWTAVLARDGQQDGRFVYAVTTTGVYCRPSCPSRRPRREHVAFFADIDGAERAGYRACLRCQPRAAQAPALALIERARTFIDAHLDEGVSLRTLAAETGLSLFHVQRRFKQVTGLTPKQYIAARRAERFKTQLKKGRSVTDATYEAGYGSSSRVYESSNATLGMTPSAYKRGGAGVRIRYATADSPFGRLLVGVTDRGICAVMLGEHDDALERTLAEEYPSAERERAPHEVERVVRDVLARLDGQASAQARVGDAGRERGHADEAGRAGVGAGVGVAAGAGAGARAGVGIGAGAGAGDGQRDRGRGQDRGADRERGSKAGQAQGAELPLDLQGTEFTWRVWRALQAIPYGETRSYGEVAKAIGAPRAVRAVARACASNPAALVIPCHRVIGATGALTGYRWGVERKRKLLDHERQHAGASAAVPASSAAPASVAMSISAPAPAPAPAASASVSGSASMSTSTSTSASVLASAGRTASRTASTTASTTARQRKSAAGR
jgi:AraC family transcriptional regulator of adaptative response/methylated-DNA-[protein]-cysteine methyltransferase